MTSDCLIFEVFITPDYETKLKAGLRNLNISISFEVIFFLFFFESRDLLRLNSALHTTEGRSFKNLKNGGVTQPVPHPSIVSGLISVLSAISVV